MQDFAPGVDPPDQGRVRVDGREESWTVEEYESRLQERIAKFLDNHTELPDYRKEYPWVTGSLGNPFARVWFVGEIPSLTQVVQAHTPGTPLTPEMQWNISDSDRLFREMLGKHGFKKDPIDGPGGWGCYITELVKMPWKNPAEWREWTKKRAPQRTAVIETWAGVLRWEFETVRPRLVVALGGEVNRFLPQLARKRLIPPLPRTARIDHPSYYQYPWARPAGYGPQFAEVRRLCEAVGEDPPGP